MSVFSQDARLGRLTTVLGPDILVLRRFDGDEALSGLFDFTVEAVATRDDLDFDNAEFDKEDPVIIVYSVDRASWTAHRG